MLNYRIAGLNIAVDAGGSRLSGLEDQRTTLPPAPPVHDSSKLVFNGEGWVGGEWKHVLCHADRNGFDIEIASDLKFRVTTSGNSIALVNRSDVATDVVETAALGPPLIVALALQDRWCCHASAVTDRDHSVLFLGPSGAGKSTMARELAVFSDTPWHRATDDVTPIGHDDRSFKVFTEFPQLKLSRVEQAWNHLPAVLPLDLVYVLDGGPTRSEVSSTRLSSSEATLALLAGTMAVRLFDHNIRRAHLDFCAQLAESIPVLTLQYPFGADVLPHIHQHIQRDLELHPSPGRERDIRRR